MRKSHCWPEPGRSIPGRKEEQGRAKVCGRTYLGVLEKQRKGQCELNSASGGKRE